MNQPVVPSRRLGDRRHPHLATLIEWWHIWGLLVQALWLFLVTAILATAIVFYAVDQHHASQTARASCKRTMKFGPPLARAYQRYGILGPAELREYRATIPTSCP